MRKYDLKEECIISDEVYSELKENIYRKAMNKALNLLEISELSRGEIEFKLKSKDFPDHIIGRVIEELYRYNYLNDNRYMECFIRSNMLKKSKGMIKRELGFKNIDLTGLDDIIDRIYQEDNIDSDEVVKNILEKKFRDADISDQKVQRRIYSYMARRGFKPAEVKAYLS